MKILIKFENFLNRTLERLRLALLKVFLILIPPFVKELYYKLLAIAKIQVTKAIIFSKNLKFLPQIISQKMTTLQKSFNTSAKVGLRQKILNNTIRKPIKEHLKTLKYFFINLKSSLINFFATPKNVFGSLGLIILCLGTYTIINSSSSIYFNEYPQRAPASIPSTKKPEYSKFKKRTMRVLNIQVPVIYDSVNDLRTVNVDFTVRTSSRFAKKFLENYEYKLKDHFFSTVEPTVSSFTIKNEGKDVLEAKIKYELQDFLEQNRVEGRVLEVNTISIIAN